MSYRFLEINLLPPELMPGPAVRYRVIIVWALVLITVALMMIDSFIGLSRISQRREERDRMTQLAANQQFIEDEYNSLKDVENYVMKTGKLVSMASADYIDLPLAASRIAKLLPDGVFLERITNNRPGKGSNISDVSVTLVAARQEPKLVLDTFNNFKADGIFSNCYMRVAQSEERSLSSLLAGADIKWMVNGPELPTEILANHYVFEINALVQSPIDNSGFKVLSDDSKYMANFERRMAEEKAAEGSTGDNTPGVVNAPPGVTVEGKN